MLGVVPLQIVVLVTVFVMNGEGLTVTFLVVDKENLFPLPL
jgi:hypothetical protein